MAIAYYAEDILLPAIKKKAVSGWIKAVAETYGKKTGDISSSSARTRRSWR